MFSRGIIVGKFYPPHRGHKYLIDYARAQCEELTVLVCWRKGQEIPGPLRAKWIQRIHPGVRVMLIDDDRLADDDSEGWAKHTLEVLGYKPDAVFTSEDYGDPYARFMDTVHVLVDKERTNVPISGTLARSDPQKYAPFLEPCVRAHFAKRIAIIGAESTGTTTLARALAEHYRTTWAPEYGRMYSEGRQPLGPGAAWTSEEFEHIARMQNALEDAAAEQSKGIVFLDTDAFATSVWHERYMNTRSEEVERIAQMRHPHLYILTGDEIPFVQDGLRDGENIRHWMHERFIARLEEDGRPYMLVTGAPEERLRKAIAAIEGGGK